MTKTPHTTSIRVYYEDTDAGGVVYYANYLKFAERARTEYLRFLGIEQTTLLEKEGILFVVRHAELDLLKPARLDDQLEVTTEIASLNKASLEMDQVLRSAAIDLAVVKTKIVCVSKDFRPVRIPNHVLDCF